MANEEAENDAEDSDDPEAGQEQYGTGEEDIDAVEQTEIMEDDGDEEDDDE